MFAKMTFAVKQDFFGWHHMTNILQASTAQRDFICLCLKVTVGCSRLFKELIVQSDCFVLTEFF